MPPREERCSSPLLSDKLFGVRVFRTEFSPRRSAPFSILSILRPGDMIYLTTSHEPNLFIKLLFGEQSVAVFPLAPQRVSDEPVRVLKRRLTAAYQSSSVTHHSE